MAADIPDAGFPDGSVLHEEVFDRIRRAIVSGQMEPGAPVSVRTLAARFGVSSMPAREAIRRLVAMGALAMSPTRRVTVATLDEKSVGELAEARGLIEPALAARALAGEAASVRDRRKLVSALTLIDVALDRAIEAGDIDAYVELNAEFHFTLYRAARAPIMLALVENMWLQTGPSMRMVMGRLGTGSLVDSHKVAIRALAAGDGEALAEAVRADIAEGMANIARAAG